MTSEFLRRIIYAVDKFSFIALWDNYNGLLTPTQQEITDLYFNGDLTVSEIAEEKGISRQAVSECLKGCKKQLEEYEEKLHFCNRLFGYSLEQSFLLTDARKWAEGIKKAHPALSGEVGALDDIFEKDYSDEVEAELKKPQNREIIGKDYTEQVFGRKKDGEE